MSNSTIVFQFAKIEESVSTPDHVLFSKWLALIFDTIRIHTVLSIQFSMDWTLYRADTANSRAVLQRHSLQLKAFVIVAEEAGLVAVHCAEQRACHFVHNDLSIIRDDAPLRLYTAPGL